jgi:hypothetical protein
MYYDHRQVIAIIDVQIVYRIELDTPPHPLLDANAEMKDVPRDFNFNFNVLGGRIAALQPCKMQIYFFDLVMDN